MFSFQNDRPFGRRNQLENGPAQRGFAAAGFPDEPENFSFLQRERNAIDGFHCADVLLENDSSFHREMGFQIMQLEKGFGHFRNSQLNLVSRLPALALTLSPGEREQRLGVSGLSDGCSINLPYEFTSGLETILPLLGGEGRGEVERFPKTNSSDSIQNEISFLKPALALTLSPGEREQRLGVSARTRRRRSPA